VAGLRLGEVFPISRHLLHKRSGIPDANMPRHRAGHVDTETERKKGVTPKEKRSREKKPGVESEDTARGFLVPEAFEKTKKGKAGVAMENMQWVGERKKRQSGRSPGTQPETTRLVSKRCRCIKLLEKKKVAWLKKYTEETVRLGPNTQLCDAKN